MNIYYQSSLVSSIALLKAVTHKPIVSPDKEADGRHKQKLNSETYSLYIVITR